jgi:MFS family permease
MAFLLGIANAFDAPARQSLVVELVDDRADLTNAIALNATMFNAATVVGPATAGFAYALFGAGWCFIINGLSFIAVIVALGLMKLRSVVPHLPFFMVGAAPARPSQRFGGVQFLPILLPVPRQ